MLTKNLFSQLEKKLVISEDSDYIRKSELFSNNIHKIKLIAIFK